MNDDDSVVLFLSLAFSVALFIPCACLNGLSAVAAHIALLALGLGIGVVFGAAIESVGSGAVCGGIIASAILWLWQSVDGLRSPGSLLIVSIIASIIISMALERLCDESSTSGKSSTKGPLKVELVDKR